MSVSCVVRVMFKSFGFGSRRSGATEQSLTGQQDRSSVDGEVEVVINGRRLAGSMDGAFFSVGICCVAPVGYMPTSSAIQARLF